MNAVVLWRDQPGLLIAILNERLPSEMRAFMRWVLWDGHPEIILQISRERFKLSSSFTDQSAFKSFKSTLINTQG